MSYLVANIPHVQCYIRKEFLYDFEKGFGEYEPCYWATVKSVKGKALYIESLLTNYGAMYDKLPISAYVWKTDIKEDELLPLDYLEIWDSFSYNISIIEKSLLKNLQCKVFMKDKNMYEGNYLFTIDSCSSDPNEINVSLSETPNEHKSFNIIKLVNGQFAAQPNNRVLFYDQSLTPKGVTKPDFKVSTKEFYCENGNKWAADDSGDFFYEVNSKN
jgi:hypothetical protein